MFHLVHGGLDQSGLFQGGVDLANFFLRKTYQAPENRPLEKEISIGNQPFLGRTVSF